MVTSNVILQAALSLSSAQTPFKVGFTATKKSGGAVVRVRVRRRLRAVVREVFPQSAKNNVDYVLIGRISTASCPYKTLKSDVKWALKKVNAMIENGIYQSPPYSKEEHKKNGKNSD